MSGSKEYFLTEITDGTPITYGVVQPGNEDSNGVSFIRSGDIMAGRIRLSQLRTITPEISNKYKRTFLCSGDLLISLVGNPGEVAIVPIELEGANIARQVGLIRLNKHETDASFIKYYFMAPHGKELLFSNTIGSVQQVINLKELKNIKVLLPPLPEQQAIAGVLSSLDDKIDLLHRQNKTLEGMAEALWRKMFVEEADSEWRKEELGNICTIKKAKPDAEKMEDYEYYVPIDCINSQSLALMNCEPVINANSSIITFDEDDILFGAMRPYFHKVTISPFKGLTRTTCFILTPKSEMFLPYLLILMFLKETIDYADAASIGSTIPYAVWENGLCEMPIIIPDEHKLKCFNTVAFPIISKIKQSFYLVKNLRNLRDTLLPKLISGEVRVRI